ncbi:hypothetical protein CSHISOI_10513 [Colletotrichum shisoi]|uniref:NmrA-like domain-containing protein n=1 Tax=Colletotrichum shisoi TaxID=2078593 RepID=A0A5Q4BDT1_9PEZI|nr:hypothetical protein CSHISOI_10513 [Colletotrichum shisoi]
MWGVSENLGQEVIDGLDGPSGSTTTPGVTWVKADYQDPKQLANILQGVDTVLSFVIAHLDPGNVAQRNLIDASVAAGVRRFAPSEWFSSSFEHLAWYHGKIEVRDYLKELNKDKKVLEYTLFQPGIIMNYFTFPHRSSKHVQPIEFPISFEKRRALIVDGSEDARINLTTIDDIVHVVTKAIDYEVEWPVIGGMRGSEITLGQFVALGEKIRGPFYVQRLQAEDLKAGVIKSDWRLKFEHPSVDPSEAEAFGTMFLSSILLAFEAGAMSGSDDL